MTRYGAPGPKGIVCRQCGRVFADRVTFVQHNPCKGAPVKAKP